MSVVIPHKNSQYFHPDVSFLAKHLTMTISPFHHWTLDFSHPPSHSLRHCRHQSVLDKIEKWAKNAVKAVNLLSFHSAWGFTLSSSGTRCHTMSLSSSIKMGDSFQEGISNLSIGREEGVIMTLTAYT